MAPIGLAPISAPTYTSTVPDTTQTPATPANIHVVKPGDSLQSIARDHNITVDDLRTANPGKVSRTNNIIRNGMELTIPTPGSNEDTAPTTDTSRRVTDGSNRVVSAANEQPIRQRLDNNLAQQQGATLQDVRNGTILETGARGEAVQQVQGMLGKLGYQTNQDGEYTDQTAGAVRQFQGANNIQQNGRMGPMTLNALEAASTSGYRAHVDVPAIRQTTSSNCDDTSEAMMRRVGTIPGQSDAEVNYFGNSASRRSNGVNYLQQQLNAGKPVMIGVDYKSGSPNADGITDHFMVATGYGTDSQGRQFISFNDPADGSKDTNAVNRLYLNPSTGQWAQSSSVSSPYRLSAVVNNR